MKEVSTFHEHTGFARAARALSRHNAGAALVFFLKRDLPEKVQKGLSGFAAGVMVAASIWSLLIPALEGAADLGA